MKEAFYDALVIKEKWLDKILSEKHEELKNWEIRGSRTTKRGKILLIQSGSGKIMGCAELTGCTGLDLVDFITHENHHRIPTEIHHNKLPYDDTFAWILKGAKRFSTPIPYEHPQGAVIWVKIPAELLINTEAERLLEVSDG